MTESIKEIRLQNRMTTANMTHAEYIKRMTYRLENETREPDEKEKRQLRVRQLQREIDSLLG